ncbi:GerAB/ArcD/ProY family transporter [Paenibacillus sp. Marseille-Q4541]|uniref:GerAB/ArcD/ProY family transporter n=1 Tax=Paenibacillus sp. Marseille-Q4541 TaxID=2831522 RepID=UPI001BAD27FE|nr:GerAB/ArcD/ProY family transporter [Paenibacillus sp. Marseille-Q4541]
MRKTDWQLARFAFVYFNSQTSVFLVPSLLSNSSYQGWIGILCGSLLNWLMIFFTVFVGRFRPDEAWVDFGKKIMGIHNCIVFLFLAWCVYYASYDIESFVLFFGANYLKATPPWFMQCVIGLVIIYTIRLGLKTIVNMSDGLFLIFATSTFIMFLFLEKANLQMLPALVRYFDYPTFVKDTLTSFSWFAEWVVFLFIAPDFKMDSTLFKKFTYTAAGITFLVMGGWLLTLLNFGIHLGKQLQFPYIDIVRNMVNAGLLGNTAPLLIGVWTASMFIHSTFLIYAATKCMTYFTKGKGQKYIVPALVTVSVGIAFYYSNHLSIYHTHFYSFTTVLIWIGIECIPMYYAIVAMIRFPKKKASKKTKLSQKKTA